ncbi:MULTISPECIES: hypothetical protein [Shewanella]|uniref:Uncharacterized protein n=1 Tax=Shewanella japonica TaxID=93973 RepID=A0ABN4YF85_9GAMM|nr:MULTISPECIES: hypothetical protein [Shewanella]ARD21761.1 hypothetical protein SJ2017_1437 [Shewanella japonica]
MQIQSYTAAQQMSANTVSPANSTQQNTSVNKPSNEPVSHLNTTQRDSVTISAQAMALSQSQSEPETQPSLPNNGEKVENYVHYKKAQTQYQFYSDLAGVANGSDDSISATSAYIIKNNDDARAATVNAANMNNQQNMLNAYVETTKSINETV